MRPPVRLDQVRHRLAQVLRELTSAAFEEDFAELCTALLSILDEECRRRLVSGRPDIFGSIHSLQHTFSEAVQRLAPRLQLPPADLADYVFMTDLFQAVLGEMHARGDLSFATDRQRARSRVFEFVHYLRNLRQRTTRGERNSVRPRLVEMVKVEVRERERAVRDIEIDDFLQGLGDLPYEADNPRFRDLPLGDVYDELVEDFGRFLQRAFPTPLFSRFQGKALSELLGAAFAAKPSSAYVITAGTGFGKTEAFLLPLLFYSTYTRRLKRRNQDLRKPRDKAGVDSILLYPRVDLCDNQAERVVRYLYELNAVLREREGDAFLPLKVALAHSRLNESFRISCPACADERARDRARWDPAEDVRAFLRAEMASPYRVARFYCERRPEHSHAAEILVPQIRTDSAEADIVITTIDTLHRRLMDEHGQRRLFRADLLPPRFVVLDEIHIYEGHAGSHAAHILRRCRRRIEGGRAEPEGATAPVFVGASATVANAADLAGRIFGSKDIADPIRPEGAERKAQGIEYYVFVQSPGNRMVSLIPGPATAEDAELEAPVLGAQAVDRFVSERATMIQAAMCLQHTMKAPQGAGAKRRVLGFVDSVDSARRLGVQLDNAEWQDVHLGAPGNPLTTAPLYALRVPPARNPDLVGSIRAAAREFSGGAVPALPITLPVLGEDCRRLGGDCRQPPHHLLERCERYESGECWFAMANPGEEGLRPISVQTHQAGLRAWGDPLRRFQHQQRDVWRTLISTSALEVGFDHPEIVATWQYHAPQSLAAFVQRKGRGGRGPRDYPISMMVLGTSAADRHAFQNHLRYVDDRDFESYVDESNPSVRQQHIFSAVLDWCAAQGHSDVYRGNVRRLVEALGQPTLRAYVRSCVEGMTPADVAGNLVRLRQYLEEIWLTPLDLSGINSAPAEPVLPWELFSRYTPAQVMGWRALAVGIVGRPRTQAWLAAGTRFHSEPGGHVSSVVDFCARVPAELLENPDLCVPSTTISVPIGRFITIFKLDGGRIEELEQEQAEFALRSFLPGGFKIRYNRELWMAPWVPAPGKVADHNHTWAATHHQLQEVQREGTPDLLADVVAASDLDDSHRHDVVARVGGDCGVTFVRGLQVQSLGARTQRTYFLDTVTKTVVLQQGAGGTARYVPLSRDPNVQPCAVTIPQPSRQWIDVSEGRGLVRAARFHPSFRLVLAQYANLVHCYPRDGDVQTIVVRFWDERLGRPLAAAIELRSQAIELEVGLSDGDVTSWELEHRVRAFWRRVEGEALEQFVVATGVLPNAYLIESVVELLRAIESRRSALGPFATVAPSEEELRVSAQHFQGHPEVATAASWVGTHAHSVARLLHGAAEWSGTRGFTVTFADTLAAVLARSAGSLVHASPWSFRQRVMIDPNRIRIYLYDDLDGGSGNARRVGDLLAKRGVDGLSAGIAGSLGCSSAMLDVAVATALASGKSPDVLMLLTAQDELPAAWTSLVSDPARLRARLERLFESPELAAFHIYAHQEYRRLERELGGPPPHIHFVDHIDKTPAADERAEVLRLRFRRYRDGVRELGPRLREVTPLCLGACEDCLGGDRYGELRYLDRTLLAAVLAAREGVR